MKTTYLKTLDDLAYARAALNQIEMLIGDELAEGDGDAAEDMPRLRAKARHYRAEVRRLSTLVREGR